jgi:hypothetical protein
VPAIGNSQIIARCTIFHPFPPIRELLHVALGANRLAVVGEFPHALLLTGQPCLVFASALPSRSES